MGELELLAGSPALQGQRKSVDSSGRSQVTDNTRAPAWELYQRGVGGEGEKEAKENLATWRRTPSCSRFPASENEEGASQIGGGGAHYLLLRVAQLFGPTVFGSAPPPAPPLPGLGGALRGGGGGGGRRGAAARRLG